jgi:glycosyltransferase involved in cell wall biosynthesis
MRSEQSNPLVAVWMVAYNHEKYIAQAIEGIVNQKSDFKFKLFIGEDCSTDATKKICLKYKKAFPDIVEVRSGDKNSIIINTKWAYSSCFNSGAKYIAMCEGDDYWTDPYKLQKQADFLEKNPNIAGCFHDAIVVDEDNKVIKDNYYAPSKEVFNQRDCLVWGGASATCSVFFRSLVLNDMPEWFARAMCDYTLDLLISEYGDIAHIKGSMGAYRIHKGGAWQGTDSHTNNESVLMRYKVCLTNPKFKKNYSNFFYNRISELSSVLSLHYQNRKIKFKKIKYACHYLYYTKPKTIQTFNYFFGTLLFPSTYKKIN